MIDEIHLVDGTPRGDQLRVLLRRVARIAAEPKIHLLSATVDDADEVAARYTSECSIVRVPGQRELDCTIVATLGEAMAAIREERARKVLCFCNKRERVEQVAEALHELWSPYPVVAHHGSLDRAVREAAEQVMKEAPVAACVATSTLEVGIDIGSIDAVLLADVPWSVTSLLQRVGRGNRRSGTTRVLAIADGREEQDILESLFAAARAGILATPPYSPDVSVVAQQVASVLFGAPAGVEETELADVAAPLCGLEGVHAIVEFMHLKGWVVREAGLWAASEHLMNEGEKGRIHSNIPDSIDYSVVDASSGQRVGRISGTFDSVFCLGRRSWQIVNVAGGEISVVPFAGPAPPAAFTRHNGRGPFVRLLPPGLTRGW